MTQKSSSFFFFVSPWQCYHQHIHQLNQLICSQPTSAGCSADSQCILLGNLILSALFKPLCPTYSSCFLCQLFCIPPPPQHLHFMLCGFISGGEGVGWGSCISSFSPCLSMEAHGRAIKPYHQMEI